MHIMQSRRDFLASASLAAAAGVLGARGSLAGEAPPEITTVRLRTSPSICLAPRYIAGDLLGAEGFTDVQYIPDLPFDAVGRGDADFDFQTAPWIASHVDAGEPIAVLAGVHVGCYELFAHEPIRTISDLKGKRVGIPQARTISDLKGKRVGINAGVKSFGSNGLLLAIMAAHVGSIRTRRSTG